VKVVGMDIGGSSVRAVLRNKYGVKKMVINRGMNLASVSEKEIEEILSKVRESFGSVDVINIGASGAGTRNRSEKLLRVLEKLFPDSRFFLKSDIEVIAKLCAEKENAVIVIAGTGSVVVSTSGKRKGGWGYLFNDEGGAFSIALRIIKRAFEFHDGLIEHDEIFDRLLDHFKVNSFQELSNIQMERNFHKKIASFTSNLIFTPLVMEILNEEMEKLARRVKALAAEESTDIVYAYGGVFSNKKIFEIFREKLLGFVVKRCDIDVANELSKRRNGI